MKWKYTLATLSLCIYFVNASAVQSDSLATKDSVQFQIEEIIDDLIQLKKEQIQQQAEIRSLKAELNGIDAQVTEKLQTALSQVELEQASLTEKVNAQLQSSQAQVNELEARIASKDAQINSVREDADARFNNLLALIIFTLLLSPILIWVSSKRVWKKAVNQQQANWNNFQEYILKKK